MNDDAITSNIAMPDDLIEYILEHYNTDTQLLLTDAWERADETVRQDLIESITTHQLKHTRRKHAIHAAEYLLTLDVRLMVIDAEDERTS